ncbi:MAG: 23S rRNA (guanosine(2251)-2'-O)-methyltransferase RlmB [Candidatus Kapaibacteriales bacterium]
MKDTPQIIFGRNSIIEALKNKPNKIEKIYLRYGLRKDFQDNIYLLARKNNVPITTLDKNRYDKLEKIYCGNSISQGVIALFSTIDYLPLERLIERALNNSKTPVLVFLDKINDPQNIGAIARSIECSGAFGLIVTAKETAPITPFAIKASAGALLYVPVAKVDSPIQSLKILKDSGFWIIGTSSNSDKNYDEMDYNIPVVIVIGNENIGIRPSIRKHCDFFIQIPMYGKIDSLNASVTTGIILFEIQRQKRSFSTSLSKKNAKDD